MCIIVLEDNRVFGVGIGPENRWFSGLFLGGGRAGGGRVGADRELGGRDGCIIL